MDREWSILVAGASPKTMVHIEIAWISDDLNSVGVAYCSGIAGRRWTLKEWYDLGAED